MLLIFVSYLIILILGAIQINSELVLGVDVSGRYEYLEMRNNKPAYKHETNDLYLFYAGWWKVDTSAIYSTLDTNARGFIRSEVDVARPELVNPGSWRYYEDNLDHSTISVTHSVGKCGTVR